MRIFKKIFVILIIMLSMLCIDSFADTGIVNVSATRLRKENNTTSEILTNIYEDEKVEIIEEVGEWLKVEYKTQIGYIKKEFVDIKEDKKQENSSEKNVSTYENKENKPLQDETTVTVLEATRLRIIPSFMSKQIEEIAKNTELKVVTRMNKWVQVTDGIITGWILSTKINMESKAPQIDASDLETTNTITNTTSSNTTNTTNQTNNIKNNTITNTIGNKVENNVTNETVKNEIENVSKKGKINVETAKVRKEPNTKGELIDLLDEGDEVIISEEVNGWYKIEHGSIKGYVSTTLITIIDDNNSVTSRSLNEERKTEKITEENENTQKEYVEEINNIDTSTGNQVVEYAKQYLGYKYVVGGKTPESGFDCSGFTRYIYKNFGYSLASVAASQTSVGIEVSREDLQPGDLVLFYNEAKTKIGHTGIYVGNGDFIHAANPERGVVYDNINTVSYYNERYVTARRIVQ